MVDVRLSKCMSLKNKLISLLPKRRCHVCVKRCKLLLLTEKLLLTLYGEEFKYYSATPTT